MKEESETTRVVEETNSAADEETKTDSLPETSTPTAKAEVEVSEAPTLREFFGIPEKASEEGDDHWKAFQKKLAEETSGIKWTAAIPDLGSKIGELLDIKIHDLLLTAWKKVEVVRQALEDSKKTPDKATYLDLTEHSIDYETKPFIDVKIKKASVKKLTLTVAMNLKLKGFGLKVQNGLIRELQAGKCEGKGTIKYEKLAVAEKKLEPIKFPVSIEIPGLIPIPVPTDKAAAEKDATAKRPKGEQPAPLADINEVPAAETKSKTEDSVERIEL